MNEASVSDFVSIEENTCGEGGKFCVVTWSRDGNPLVIYTGTRPLCELMVGSIRDSLATWPGWKRTN